MKQFKKQQGFTIVEIMIVLAVAAVIMLVVFLAVPALQRNNRNTQRRNDATHLAGLLNEYAANHSGQMPASWGKGCALDTTNETFAIISNNTATCTGANAVANAAAVPAFPAIDVLSAGTNLTCANNVMSVAGGTRSTVIFFQVEPGPTGQCIQV
jgi:prepilin-type N-terminal cleavage/methylation domain-containing protein